MPEMDSFPAQYGVEFVEVIAVVRIDFGKLERVEASLYSLLEGAFHVRFRGAYIAYRGYGIAVFSEEIAQAGEIARFHR